MASRPLFGLRALWWPAAADRPRRPVTRRGDPLAASGTVRMGGGRPPGVPFVAIVPQTRVAGVSGAEPVSLERDYLDQSST